MLRHAIRGQALLPCRCISHLKSPGLDLFSFIMVVADKEESEERRDFG